MGDERIEVMGSNEASTRGLVIATERPRIVATRRERQYKPDYSNLKFGEWISHKKASSERSRFLLSEDEYNVLMKVVLRDVGCLERNELRWTKELMRKMSLEVVKRFDQDKGMQVDTLVHPSIDKFNKNVQLVVAHMGNIEKIIHKYHVGYTKHGGIHATYDAICQEYTYITRECVAEFIKRCEPCQVKQIPQIKTNLRYFLLKKTECLIVLRST
jgi:hypothetical protein